MYVLCVYCCYVCFLCLFVVFFFFQAEDGIRDLVRSRGLGDVYKRQYISNRNDSSSNSELEKLSTLTTEAASIREEITELCLLYTSDAADDLLCVDLGGRRIIKKKKD